MSVVQKILGRIERRAAPWIRPVLDLWGAIPVHTQGRVLVILPLFAILFSSGMAYLGNTQRARIEAAFERHLASSQAAGTVMTLMVNAETGMRGFLLTHRDDFLEPYVQAESDLPGALHDLQRVAASEPGIGPRTRKLAAVARLTESIDRQMADLSWQQAYVAGDDPSGDEIFLHLTAGKQMMDAIREDVASIQREEDGLLHERLAEIGAIRTRDYAAIFVTLIVALLARFVAWYLFNRGTVHRIDGIAHHLTACREGVASHWEPSGKLDAIGRLEAEIAHLNVPGKSGQRTAPC